MPCWQSCVALGQVAPLLVVHLGITMMAARYSRSGMVR
jgi:hypothetical protein